MDKSKCRGVGSLILGFLLTFAIDGCGPTQHVLNGEVKLELYVTCQLGSDDESGLIAKLLKEGKNIITIQNQAKFKFKLDHNSSYKLLISKPGFQKKILFINTGNVSIKRWNKGFHRFELETKLKVVDPTLDPDPLNVKRDALIEYDSEIDDFNFSK